MSGAAYFNVRLVSLLLAMPDNWASSPVAPLTTFLTVLSPGGGVIGQPAAASSHCQPGSATPWYRFGLVWFGTTKWNQDLLLACNLKNQYTTEPARLSGRTKAAVSVGAGCRQQCHQCRIFLPPSVPPATRQTEVSDAVALSRRHSTGWCRQYGCVGPLYSSPDYLLLILVQINSLIFQSF